MSSERNTVEKFLSPLRIEGHELECLVRPWGVEEVLATNAGPCSVHIVTIQQGEVPSRHSHQRRDELFVVMEGEVRFEVGVDGVESYEGGPGTWIFFRSGSIHRLLPLSEGTHVRLLEIDFGERLQDDIVRFADDYGRS